MEDSFSEHNFVFRGRANDRVKALRWNDDGLAPKASRRAPRHAANQLLRGGLDLLYGE